MINPWAKTMDPAVEVYFRKDPSGRLVFLPFGPRREAYFVDSPADEEKLKALVKSYRTTCMLLSFLVYPTIYLPGLLLNIYGGGRSLHYKLTTSVEILLAVMAVFLSLLWMSWSRYKASVAEITRLLPEVGPDVKDQLRQISPRNLRVQRVTVLCIAAGLIVMAAALFWATRLSRSNVICPPTTASASR